ncbi:MAG TPA: prolipoprotein diacylglyceryl transferase [Verrucomicrobiota bacterium]|nr:prolipoprotein diacylglyceryl transferase [Verrucomicrobiota bacterium]HNU52601.1 prolipoprotein diacylglyceryl transferase [Verrucomicrobiota bacterium]
MNPVAFSIGGLTIHWYGLLIVAGFLAGLWTASRRAPLEGLSGEAVADLTVWLMAGAIVGARLFHVVGYWRDEFAARPLWEIFAIRHGGLVFHGGLLGAALATVFYARRHKLPLWRLADVLAPSIALGQVLGRFGCFFEGCCYGQPTRLPWAVHYSMDHATLGAGVHPAPLYEAALNLALYGGLAWHFRHKRFAGQTFALYLVGYGLLRIGVEVFRGDYVQRYLGGWATPGQLMSLVVLAAGLGLYRILGRNPSGRAGTAAR